MALVRTKLAAAAVLVAGGLGAVLYPAAVAQQPGGATAPPAVPARATSYTQATPPPATPAVPPTPAAGGAPGMAMARGSAPARAQWEYKFVAGGFPAKDFVQLFTDLGNDGWEFCGYYEFAKEQLADALKAHPDKIVVKPGSLVTLMFKRAKGPAGGVVVMGTGPFMPPGMVPGGSPSPEVPPAPAFRPLGEPLRPPAVAKPVEPTPANPAARRLTVVPLKNAEAAAAAELLEKVFKGAATVTPDPRTNALIIRADEEALTEVKALIERLDAPAGKAGNK